MSTQPVSSSPKPPTKTIPNKTTSLQVGAVLLIVAFIIGLVWTKSGSLPAPMAPRAAPTAALAFTTPSVVVAAPTAPPSPMASPEPVYALRLDRPIMVYFAPVAENPQPVNASPDFQLGYNELEVRPDGWTAIQLQNSGQVWTLDLHPPVPTAVPALPPPPPAAPALPPPPPVVVPAVPPPPVVVPDVPPPPEPDISPPRSAPGNVPPPRRPEPTINPGINPDIFLPPAPPNPTVAQGA